MRKYKTLAGLLGKRERWTKHAEARDSHGNVCAPTDSEACSVCLVGAVELLSVFSHAGWMQTCDAVEVAIAQEFPQWAGAPIEAFNDSPRRQHAHIVRVAKRADKILRQTEATER